VFAFGDAPFLGAATGITATPIVGMAASEDGRGYWLVASDGGIFAFGDAPFLGSTGGLRLNQPVVGMAAGPSGQGYWLVAADGGVFAFGDAPFLGSPEGAPAPVVGVASAANGRGYWIETADGSLYAYGSARFAGALRTDPDLAPATALAVAPDGQGYWEAAVARPLVLLGPFVATCYTGGGHTATGTPTSLRVIAVDPGVIPLGAQVLIPGIGVRTALDTGGAIRGARIDVWQPSLNQCVQFGVQRVQVLLIW